MNRGALSLVLTALALTPVPIAAQAESYFIDQFAATADQRAMWQAGMDAFARGLKIAAEIRADGELDAFVKDRYSSWDGELGQKIENGQASLKDLEAYMLEKGEAAANTSGRQEMLENLINRYL